MTQFPGVSQDSTSSGDYHVRNEHANVQFRINGIILPDGISGFAQFLETSFIGKMALITGALPAQYGLHNTAILDITSKDFTTNPNQGSIGVYGGSQGTITPTFEYGGKSGNTEYFFAGREFQNFLGLENPTANATALHDFNTRGGFFGYTSTFLDDSTRISTITGATTIKYQIPTNPGQPVFPGLFPIYGANATGGDSAKINEVQYEKNVYGVLAWQHTTGDLDMQLAYFSRYNSLLFVPDVYGDILFNGIASNVYRSSFMNGVQGDNAYKINDVHTVRFGFNSSVEQGIVRTVSTVEPARCGRQRDRRALHLRRPQHQDRLSGRRLSPGRVAPHAATDPQLGRALRRDVAVRRQVPAQPARQFRLQAVLGHDDSCRLRPLFHAAAADARGPSEHRALRNTTGAPPTFAQGPILPERSNVVDAGITQQLLPPCPTATSVLYGKAPIAAVPALNCPSLEVGMAGFYKRARDLLDDGQFGAAYILTAFNYDKAEIWGVEWKAKFTTENFTAYGNFSWGRETAQYHRVQPEPVCAR